MDNAASSGRTTDPVPRLTPFYLANAFRPCKSSTLAFDTLRFMLSTTTNADRLHVTTGSFISPDCAVTDGVGGGNHSNVMQI